MIFIRRATIGDIDELHALGKTVSEFSVSEGTVTFWPKTILRSAVESDEVTIFVARDTDKLVGFIIASISRGLRKAVIENIFVSPSYRGKKLGDDLLTQLTQELRGQQCEYIATLIPLDAIRAYGVYTNAGFNKGESFLWLDKVLSSEYKK